MSDAAPAPTPGSQSGEAAAPATKSGKERWEGKLAVADLVSKALQVLAVIVSAFWGLKLYLDQRDKELAAEQHKAEEQTQQEKERIRQEKARQCAEAAHRAETVRLRWYEERRPVYLEACRAAADIAAAPHLTDARDSIHRFRSLYWGHMCLVEDSETMRCMVRFYQQLEDELPRGGPPSEALKRAALNLAQACRDSLNLRAVFGVKDDVDLNQKFPVSRDFPY